MEVEVNEVSDETLSGWITSVYVQRNLRRLSLKYLS